VSTRFDAARKFAQHEGIATYQPLIYQPSDVVNSRETASLNGSAKQEKEVGESLIATTSNIKNGNSLAEIVAATMIFDRGINQKQRRPIPQYRGEKNELSATERIGWVILIAIGAALSFGGILAGLEALSRLRG